MAGRQISEGYILAARKLLKSFLMDKPPLWLKLWVWMLLRARFRDGDYLKRGQLITSIEEMRESMSYKVGYRKKKPSRDQIRSAYEAFVKATMITTTKTTRGMIVTVCNYNEYQDPKNYESHSEAHGENTAKPQHTPHDREGMGRNENEGRIPPKSPLPEYAYPAWLNLSLWKDFVDHRKAMGKPLRTNKAITLNINRLKGFVDRGYRQEEIVNLAIERGWQSFYEPRIDIGNQSKASKRIRNNMAASNAAEIILFGDQNQNEPRRLSKV